MFRIAFGISYDGTDYRGWQAQKGLKTIQGELEAALFSVANHAVSVVCAGRTDAGVHASEQVVHFDTTSCRSVRSWVFGVNSRLSPNISVLWAKEVEQCFHARFSARARRYRYVIYNHATRPGILHNAVGWYFKPLDENRMKIAARYFLGEHDFRSFQSKGCQSKTSVRIISQIKIFRVQRMIVIEVQGNAFLLHMIRNIVGVLIAVGSGRKEPEWADFVLKSRDYCHGKITMAVSPNGLYLTDVIYPRKFKLPQTQLKPFLP
ncbi:tRNA pseudouridine(38-40) synthase TruA [Coxiella endosymbiont of Amblyomma americanum]|uniref:tRNA pseudouridine(38-40) synthase TruA n=1 Tax=Coxiella endosymbiont of Amblyomma americanum TaxID=325775 RepID=UPI00057DEB3B|nr:tRNA pseudouridine(38-40) synthase TruA [Coxiella endosymbiont of Amblyomma americanum]AJC50566.1 pseudouridine synthase [Coxiella endosymbiont of Amblyomma americanum]AUJ58899.1 tRNA pseudouridine synthase A [Coxiella-like endosymbiont of Amblyomma americanum]